MFCDSDIQKELEFRPGNTLHNWNTNVSINTDVSKRCYTSGRSTTNWSRSTFRSRVLVNNEATDHLAYSGASRSNKITFFLVWFVCLFSCFQCLSTVIICRLLHVTLNNQKSWILVLKYLKYVFSQEFHLSK